MRRFAFGAALAALLMGLGGQANAQSGAACNFTAMAPITKTANYTLTANDNCRHFVFITNASTLSIPAAGVLPPGFNVWVKSQGVTTTVTPTTATLDGATTSISLTTGTGVGLYSDGTNAFSTGLGISH